MKAQSDAGVQEWRNHWPLPLAAMVGYSTSSLHTYGMGAFIEPLEQAFGWGRSQATFGLTIAGLTGASMAVPVGLLIDRVGPRIVALFGIVAMTGSFALLGTATGTMANWIMLWCLVAVANLGLQVTVWTKAVGSRFEHSRGMAFAIALSGAPVTATVLPVVATWLIIHYDWRTAFAGVGLIWFVIGFTSLAFFFRGAQEEAQKHGAVATSSAGLAGLTFAEAARTSAFYKLLVACGLFSFTVIGLTVHFVPILTGQGADRMAASGVASLLGLFAIVGRFGTGFLLDRMPAHLIGAVIFLFPLVSCVLLLVNGTNPTSQIVAAVLFGLTVGAEIDVVAYLASRRFGLKSYGSIFGTLMAALAFGMALGPLAAAAFFDRFGSYAPFLILTMAAMVVSSLALLTVNRDGAGEGKPVT